MIEATTIAPLGLLAQEARGIEYGIDDVALNVAFAFGAGAGLSLLADGAKGAFRIARSAQIKTDPNIVKEMDELKSPLDDTKTTTDDVCEGISDSTLDYLMITGSCNSCNVPSKRIISRCLKQTYFNYYSNPYKFDFITWIICKSKTK